MSARLPRLLASLLAGAAVSFAVPAYAAGMLEADSDLASGAVAAVGCDADGVTTTYSVVPSDAGLVVAAVVVSGIDEQCRDGEVHIGLRDAAGATLASGSVPIAGPDASVPLSSPPTPAAVAGVHVVLAR